jgi:hypothetical protein
MADKFKSGPAFTIHVPVHPHGTDPSQTVKAIGQPAPVRQRETFQWIKRGLGHGLVGKMGNGNPLPAPATANIAVTWANCVPGTHLIRVGKYELRPAVDFAVGANDIDLSNNLAAAINALPGYAAVGDGVDTVTITTTTAHGDDHLVQVVEWGAASAFAVTTASTIGPYLDRGEPTAEAPEFV